MQVLARNWGWVALRGVAALLFGLVALFRPGISLAAFVLLFGAYALADGVFTVVAAIANRRGERHGVSLLVSGIAAIVVGVLALAAPRIAVLVPLYFIAAWAVITGVAGIVAAMRLREVITGEWLLALAGVVLVVLGLALVVFPGAAALAVMLWIGGCATILGGVLIALAFRLQSWGKQHAPQAVPPAA